MTNLIIRDFADGDEVAFKILNEEWIRRWFVMEPSDFATLDEPRRKVIDRGGRIFMAVADGVAVGCCALIPMDDGALEIAKMAVTPEMRKGGVGRKLLEEAVRVARSLGTSRLYLETNRTLGPAIALYERVGFTHLADFASPYARADVAMEMLL